MHQHQQKHTLKQEMLGFFALLIWWAQTHAFPCKVFLRRWGTWGNRYAGLPAVFALFYLPVFCVFLKIPQGFWLVSWVWLAYVLGLLVHRGKGLWLRSRGYDTHSRYVGDSRVGYRWEPVACLLVGGLVYQFSPPVGIYVLVAAPALWLDRAFMHAADRHRLRAIRDARYEARFYAEREEDDG